MPTITLRLNESTKRDLDAVARSRGVSLSDLFRSALDYLLERDPTEDRLDVAPSSLTAVERQQLALLHRILARVVGEDNDVDGDKRYQLDRAEVLEHGFAREYTNEFAAIYPEMSVRDGALVVDILDLFRVLTFSLEKLESDGIEISEDFRRSLEFSGFDGSSMVEGPMLSYARYLVSEDRWSELRDTFSDQNDFGDSHRSMSDVYKRMLSEMAEIREQKRSERGRGDAYLLNLEELRRIALSRVHPSRRVPGSTT